MTKNYFETDKIQTVTLTQETDVEMEWYEERPEKIYKFLGITTSIDKKLKAGWGWKEHRERYSTEELISEYSQFRVNEKEMKVYSKAHVSICFSYKHSVGCRFDSNEAAQQYVDNLIEDSGRKFNVIMQ